MMMRCLQARIWLTRFGSAFSSCKHPHYHGKGRSWREKGWIVLLGVLTLGEAKEWRGHPSGRIQGLCPPDSQHGWPALISAGLPQSTRLFTSLGHLTRCLLSAALFSASCATLSCRVESRPVMQGIRRVTFMFSPNVWWPVCHVVSACE